MEILASCSLEDSLKYNGKVVLPSEEKKSPDKVSFNIIVEDGDEGVYKNLKGNERCITFKGKNASFCPTELYGKVFNEVSLEDLKEDKVQTVNGITTLVRLEDSFTDMRELYDLSKKYPGVRFIGGYLLKIEGVGIGRYDEGKDKLPPVYKEMYDRFLEVELKDLDGLQEVIKRNKKKLETSEKIKKRKEGKSKEKKESKRVAAFSSLFGNSSVEF